MLVFYRLKRYIIIHIKNVENRDILINTKFNNNCIFRYRSSPTFDGWRSLMLDKGTHIMTITRVEMDPRDYYNVSTNKHEKRYQVLFLRSNNYKYHPDFIYDYVYDPLKLHYIDWDFQKKLNPDFKYILI